MHYRVKNHDINSQNAAKPHSQTSKQVVKELSIIKAKSILDLGCGKLRYSDYLYKISENICFSDSKLQLERLQKIKGEHSTVKEYVAQNYPSSKCVPIEDIQKVKDTYDLIFCSNVLSAIPCEITLNKTMLIIYNLLSDSGKALIVNQHRSSYFKKFEAGEPHLHGYLYEGKRGSSYYGIIDKATIEGLAEKQGFSIDAFVKGDQTFAFLTKHIGVKTRRKYAA